MENATRDDALFRIEDGPDESLAFPTPYSGGPWNPDHQHGGAVSGLLARSIDRTPSPVDMRLARLTVEMFRGVPLTPLRVVTRVVRGGRRIQSVEANLFDGDKQVARATALRIRRSDAVPEMVALPGPDPFVESPPEVVPEMVMRTGLPMPGFVRAVEIVTAPPTACGEPAKVWTRLRCRLVEGEETSPSVRLATLADFASGTGNVMDYEKYTSINPDLSIHFLREPRTDWLALSGITWRADDGIGQSRAVAHDEEGPIANIQACLLLDRR